MPCAAIADCTEPAVGAGPALEELATVPGLSAAAVAASWCLWAACVPRAAKAIILVLAWLSSCWSAGADT
eukprot:14423749-Alexandrium_andersonii.AAC.1